MNTDPPSLANLRVGISISVSASNPSPNDEAQVNRTTKMIASTLLGLGANIALGHRWKPGGVMEAIANWVRLEFRHELHEARTAGHAITPKILNLMAWPDSPPAFNETQQRSLQGILESQVIQPESIETTGLLVTSELGCFARIRALTAMRKELARRCDARFCIGGAAGAPQRRLSGVIEESLLTWEAGKPLYISSALGGSSQAMADVILQRRLPEDSARLFFTPPVMVEVIKNSASPDTPTTELASDLEGWNALDALRAIPFKEIVERSGLSRAEYLTMLTIANVTEAVSLVARGLQSLKITETK